MNKKAIAYIRISDKNRGSADTQKQAIKAYCESKNFLVIDYIEEYVSASKTNVQDRLLQQVVHNMEEGTSIVMSDITRLGRRKVFDLLGVVGQIVSKGELHLAYTGRFVSTENMDDAETIFTIVGGSYAAVDEAKKRSQRAKAAHSRAKAAGLHVGRKYGQKVRSKLDAYSMKIAEAVKAKSNKTELAREIGCSRMQLHRWIEKNITTN